MLRFLLSLVFVVVFSTDHALARTSLLTPEVSFGSKQWQKPKPYFGIGFLLSSLAPGKEEEMQGSFFNGLAQFRNLSAHVGMRINGFLGVEIEYGRPYKTISSGGFNHSFSGDMLSLKGIVYPLSLDFAGGLFSAELLLTAGLNGIIGMDSGYVNASNQVVSDNLNNTVNILYGAGLQIGFIKYVSARFEVNAISPLNGKPFGDPYGSVMLFYNFKISFYPF